MDLKTNTATRITVGPFFDKTDGVTPETAITVTSCKLTMTVDTGGVPTLVLDTNPTASAGNNDMVHITGDDSGMYDLELTAANLNYVGNAKIVITDPAVHVPVIEYLRILPADVYDSLYNTVGAAPMFGIVDQGTLQSATGTTAVLRSAAAFANDELNGATLQIVAGTGIGQSRIITDYVSSTDTATVDTWTTTPDSTSRYKVFGTPPSPTSAAGIPAVNVTHYGGTAGTFSAGIPEVKVNNIAAGAVTAAAVATGAIDADALAADAVDEILDEVVEGTTTFRQMLRGFAAVLMGKASGLATTTAVYRDIGDTKDRISATVDADGNRTAVTKDLT
jgi:hypothetical protein